MNVRYVKNRVCVIPRMHWFWAWSSLSCTWDFHLYGWLPLLLQFFISDKSRIRSLLFVKLCIFYTMARAVWICEAAKVVTAPTQVMSIIVAGRLWETFFLFRIASFQSKTEPTSSAHVTWSIHAMPKIASFHTITTPVYHFANFCERICECPFFFSLYCITVTAIYFGPASD